MPLNTVSRHSKATAAPLTGRQTSSSSPTETKARQQKQRRAERRGQARGDASPDRKGSGGSCLAAMVE